MKRRLTSRGIQIVLAVLWIIDGLFQLQPKMFTKAFATQIIAPSAAGQPGFISAPITYSLHIISFHPVLYGILFAVIQLAIGILILVKPTIRLGLVLSILWGLFVWYLGEGAGGIFSAQTSLFMGAPGASLLYALISLAVFPRKKKSNDEPASWLLYVWAITWIGGGIYQLLPGQNSLQALSSMIAGNASGAPSWLSFIDTHVAGFLNGFGTPVTSMAHMNASQMASMAIEPQSGYWVILLLAFIQLAIGVGVFLPKRARQITLGVGIILSFIFWIIGQSLGYYFTGLATDPSTAPLLILVALAILSQTSLDIKLKKLYKQIEQTMIGSTQQPRAAEASSQLR